MYFRSFMIVHHNLKTLMDFEKGNFFFASRSSHLAPNTHQNEPSKQLAGNKRIKRTLDPCRPSTSYVACGNASALVAQFMALGSRQATPRGFMPTWQGWESCQTKLALEHHASERLMTVDDH